MVGVALALSGCAGPAGGTASGSGSPSGASGGVDGVARSADDLVVVASQGDGSPPQSWTLTCSGGGGGTHPQPQEACEHLAGMTDPFAPLPADVMCTEQYGGPQTARVTGSWHGDEVELDLSRTDGCRISQWDSLGPVLPVPVGVDDSLG
ncbi:hypothetical protein E4P43_11070 [Blastococcus sp. TF02A-35]|nr:hypothetical protein E4P43_11070 [Blastococcus sp. TF02A_35]